ncbi:MAG: hypothetical protein V4661_00760, partial [Pseudomonadota bacterium]
MAAVFGFRTGKGLLFCADLALKVLCPAALSGIPSPHPEALKRHLSAVVREIYHETYRRQRFEDRACSVR